MSLAMKKRLLERDDKLQFSRAAIKHLIRRVAGNARCSSDATLLIHLFMEDYMGELGKEAAHMSKWDDIRHGAVPAEGVVTRGVDVEEAEKRVA